MNLVCSNACDASFGSFSRRRFKPVGVHLRPKGVKYPVKSNSVGNHERDCNKLEEHKVTFLTIVYDEKEDELGKVHKHVFCFDKDSLDNS